MGLEDSRGDTSAYAEFRISLIAEPDGNDPARPRHRRVAVGSDGREAQGCFLNPLTPWMVDADLLPGPVTA